MKIIAIINQKGGVGKTSSCINLGAGLARLNKKTVLIDLDPQAHLTYGLGIEAHTLPQSIYELLKGEASAQEVFVERGELKVIPSTLDLSGAELELSGIPAGKYTLATGQIFGRSDGEVLYIWDHERQRLAVYTVTANGLSLLYVRNCSFDLKLDEFSAAGKSNQPPVSMMKKRVQQPKPK